MSILRRRAVLPAVGVLVALAAGLGACADSSGGGGGGSGGGSASCAYVVEFGGGSYLGTGDLVDDSGPLRTGEALGPATLLGCDDGGGTPTADDTETAYRIVGVPAQYAVAFGPDAQIVVAQHAQVPPRVSAILRAAR